MFEIIMYLFENYIHKNSSFEPDAEHIVDELELAGYNKPEIDKAFAWFAGLADTTEENHIQIEQTHQNADRIYTTDEKKKLGRRCLGFLIFLGQVGVLTPPIREAVIDRAMAVENKRIDIEQLKWITLMVLFHQADKDTENEPDLSWMESLVFSESHQGTVH